MVVGREVGGGLHADRVVQDEPRHCDGTRHVERVRLVGVRPAYRGLGPEVLDDDFLDVPVGAMQVADRDQRVHALGKRLTDADQEAGGEGDRQLAGLAQHAKPHRRLLVRRPLVYLAASAKPRRHALEHEPQAHVHAPEARHLVARENAGVRVRQEPVLERGLARALDVRRRRGMAPLGEEGAVAGERHFRFVAETHERLRAAERTPTARPGRDLVELHGPSVGIVGILPERAVRAAVPAEVRDREEHLG